MERAVGFPSQGEITGTGIQGKVLRGWTKRRVERLSLRLKCNRSEEYWREQGYKGDKVISRQKQYCMGHPGNGIPNKQMP